MKLGFAIRCLLLTGWCGAPALLPAQSPTPPPPAAIQSDIEYGRGGGRPLLCDVARPVNPSGPPTPAVIFIHGGAWSGGDKRGGNVAVLAQQGYFAVSINYRLSTEAPFPAAVEDCKCAVRWVRAHAAQLGVNPDAIAVWGTSAGGHLAAFLAVTADNPRFEGRGGWSNISSRVTTAISFAGPSDLTAAGFSGSGKVLPEAVARFIGVPIGENPEAYRLASPIAHVTKSTAPMLLVHGDRDDTVHVQHSVRMARALEQAGVEHRLVIVENGGHGLQSVNGQPTAPEPQEVYRTVADWLAQHLRNKPAVTEDRR